MDLTELTAHEAADAICSGRVSSEEFVQACLDRTATVEETVKAWAYLDPEYALTQARAADERRQLGQPLGPLHGLPVGVKDIFDTKDMPTEDGTVLHKGRRPAEDATVVALLRKAGAVIMGKTVTTELAVYSPGKTTNPRAAKRTPGGSSSGSAAAVAAGMIPLGVGTQTNGSVIRPASYCGVYAYKPTHGLISRHRILQQSRPLDQVGVFGRTVEDLALLAEPLMAFDGRDPDTQPRAHPRLLKTATEEPPVTPNIAFVKTPVWEQAEESTRVAFSELAEHLGDNVEEVSLPGAFDGAIEWHRTIMEADLARSFEREYATGRDKLSDVLCEMIERGQKVLAVDYNNALERAAALNTLLAQCFERWDAFLTPASTGEAPIGLESTGSPIFCTLWTLCGTPSITLPLFEGADSMPFGAQLVGPKGDDARLLRTARWLANSVTA